MSPSPPGVATLIAQRGDQSVKFSEVADHLADYIERHPETAQTVDAVARFLASVEDRDHHHAEVPGPGSDA